MGNNQLVTVCDAHECSWHMQNTAYFKNATLSDNACCSMQSPSGYHFVYGSMCCTCHVFVCKSMVLEAALSHFCFNWSRMGWGAHLWLTIWNLPLQPSPVFVAPQVNTLLMWAAAAVQVGFLNPPESPSDLWAIRNSRSTVISSIVQEACSFVGFGGIGNQRATERQRKTVQKCWGLKALRRCDSLIRMWLYGVLYMVTRFSETWAGFSAKQTLIYLAWLWNCGSLPLRLTHCCHL